jgi:hypothetical protein
VNSGVDKSAVGVHVTVDKQISEYEKSEIERAIRQQPVTGEYSWTD